MSNEELAIKIKEGNKEYIGQLWLQVEKYISAYIRKFISRTSNLQSFTDDLYQVSYFALLDAIDSFDADKGYKLLTYLQFPLKKAFASELGYRTVKNRRDPSKDTISIDAEVGNDGESNLTLADVIPDKTSEEEFERILNCDFYKQMNSYLKKAIESKLNEDEQLIMFKILEGYRNISEVSRRLGVSRQWGSIVYNKGLRKLRHYFSIHRRDIEQIEIMDIIEGSYNRGGVGAYKSREFTSSTEYAAMQLLEKYEARMETNKMWFDKLGMWLNKLEMQ